MWCLLKWALNEALVRRFITLKNLLQCTHSHQALTSSTKLKHNVLQPLHLHTIKCRLLKTDYLDVFGHKKMSQGDILKIKSLNTNIWAFPFRQVQFKMGENLFNLGFTTSQYYNPILLPAKRSLVWCCVVRGCGENSNYVWEQGVQD